ncbi:hypothetical protein [Fervidibacter sp.]
MKGRFISADLLSNQTNGKGAMIPSSGWLRTHSGHYQPLSLAAAVWSIASSPTARPPKN